MDMSRLEDTGGMTALMPPAARRYVAHTAEGKPIRQLAREAGCHASTILRQVRKLETLRDDPLVDRALTVIEASADKAARSDADLGRVTDALDKLGRSGALLVFNTDLSTPAIVRTAGDGETQLLGPVPIDVAAALVLRGWIVQCGGKAVKRYRLTSEGRLSLPDLLAMRDKGRSNSTPVALDLFAEASPDRRSRDRSASNGPGSESPLVTLSRRRGPDGKPFLAPAFVAAGDRLYEDFGIAGFDKSDLLGWERPEQLDPFYARAEGIPNTSRAGAITRTLDAIRDLGPGLSDVALRCCCLREGLETAEKRLGWSARSGKVVLRIALQRLSLFYATRHGRKADLIG